MWGPLNDSPLHQQWKGRSMTRNGVLEQHQLQSPVCGSKQHLWCAGWWDRRKPEAAAAELWPFAFDLKHRTPMLPGSALSCNHLLSENTISVRLNYTNGLNWSNRGRAILTFSLSWGQTPKTWHPSFPIMQLNSVFHHQGYFFKL